MTFNHLIWIKRNIHVCTGLRAWVWNSDHRKLDFSGVSSAPGAVLMADRELCGKAASKRNNVFLMLL